MQKEVAGKAMHGACKVQMRANVVVARSSGIVEDA